MFRVLLTLIVLVACAAGYTERRRRAEQDYACPKLAVSAVCSRATNGFTYSDGCNTITCHIDGTGQATTKYCPAPDGAGGSEYCQQAEREMRAKKDRAKLRGRCLEAANVCKGPNVRQIAYNNGCNRCFCTGQGDESCTRRACPKVLMTDEEFAEYCKQRGAGTD